MNIDVSFVFWFLFVFLSFDKGIGSQLICSNVVSMSAPVSKSLSWPLEDCTFIITSNGYPYGQCSFLYHNTVFNRENKLFD